jgi:uncharacterized membrane protein YtjA (UPF0391 family)
MAYILHKYSHKRRIASDCMRHPATGKGDYDMLTWALAFFVLALIAGVLGFGGIAGAAAGIAKVLFLIFLVLLVISAIAAAVRGRPPV